MAANAAHNYAIIQLACKEVAACPKWLGNAKVQKLKFSKNHIHGLLKRNNMGRKRLSTKVHPKPTPVADVRAAQEKIAKSWAGRDPRGCCNTDETGINFAKTPEYIYIQYQENEVCVLHFIL